MKSKIFSFIAIQLFLSASLYSAHVPEKTARQVATNWFSHQTKMSDSEFKITSMKAGFYNDKEVYYIYNFDKHGFVIVSADDSALPIIGYSDESGYSADKTNPEFDFWMQSYAEQISTIIDSKLSNSKTISEWNNILNKNFSTKNSSEIAPFVTTLWDQGGYYDNLCPTGTPTGCVATAAAQVLKYYNYPSTGVSSHSYVHPTYGLQSASFQSTTYDWQSMPNSVSTANTAVATLMYHLGVAVDMDYAVDGSGTQTEYLLYALPNYFKYSHDIAYADRTGFVGGDEAWVSLIKAEMDALRPVIYSGYSAASGGHAFVFDGYNLSDQFHVNWGWGGYLNGYFTIGNLNPNATTSFNDYNGILYNIKPAETPEFKAVNKFSGLSDVATAASPSIGQMDAVNNYVAWGIGRDGSGSNLDYRIYTKTVDGGLTWSAKAITNLGGKAFSMIHGLSADVAYICMYGATAADNKILKTIDGGGSWTVSKSSGAHSASFFNIVHFFNESDGIILGDPDSEFEIHTTSDGGQSWTRVAGANIPNPLTGEYGIVGLYDAVVDTIWFTTNRGRVFKSMDKGQTWTKKTIVSTTTDTNLDVAFSDDALHGLMSYFDSDTKTYSAYNTTDGGETWNLLENIQGNFYTGDISAVPGVTNKFYSVGTDATTPALGISYSDDGGNTWNDIAEYYKRNQYTSIAMASENKGFIGSFAGDYTDGVWMLGNLEPLMPRFAANDTQACINTDVTFTSTSTGQIESYEWNFGTDATPPTATGVGPHIVQYSTGGYKSVSLSISNSEVTETNNSENYLSVAEFAPSVTEIVGDARVRTNTTHTYTVNSPQPDNTDYAWTLLSGSYYFTLLSNDAQSVELKAKGFNNKTGVLQVVASNGCGVNDPVTITVVTDNTIDVDNLDESSVMTFPNPANTELNIVSETVVGQVTFTNIAGQTVKSVDVNGKSAKISLENLNAGLYFVNINTENSTITQKVIVK